MAFAIRCRDGKRYTIGFSKDDPLRMIRVRAGACQLDDVIYKGERSKRDMATFRLLGNEHLQPGGVYYVGDFEVNAGTRKQDPTFITSSFGMYRKVSQTWQLFDPRNNYAATTAEMKHYFPNFASVATEDRMPRQ
jgi:hypothetical protein